jgi:oligosaccharide repeat unit polymerase
MRFAFAILLAAAVLACAATAHAVTALALISCLVTLIPIVVKKEKVDLFSPWNYMFYYVVLNVVCRYIFVDFQLGREAIDLNYVFYLDKPAGFLTASMGIMLLGFSFLTLGYMLPANKAVKLDSPTLQARSFNAKRFNRAVVAMLVISASAFAAFVALTFTGADEFAFALLSRHRGISNNLDEYRAHGYLRLLIGLSNIVIYLVYVRLRLENKKHRRFDRAAFWVAILISVAMAFYSQGRAALVFVFLNIVFLKYYIDKEKFPWKMFAVIVPLVVALFVVTSSLRGGTGVNLRAGITPMTVVGPIVLNNGGIDASKTGHIVDYIDQTQDYQFGATLVQFVWAAVPRELWHNKPASLDTFVGEKIYGARTYGTAAVPAGFFGEMYMNFWYVGIVVGALLLGALMKTINNLLVANKDSPNFVLCYVILLQSFGMSILASGVSSVVMGTLMSGLPLILVLRLVVARDRSRTREHVVATNLRVSPT